MKDKVPCLSQIIKLGEVFQEKKLYVVSINTQETHPWLKVDLCGDTQARKQKSLYTHLLPMLTPEEPKQYTQFTIRKTSMDHSQEYPYNSYKEQNRSFFLDCSHP